MLGAKGLNICSWSREHNANCTAGHVHTLPTKFIYKMLHQIIPVLPLLHNLHVYTQHVGTTDDRLCKISGSQSCTAGSQILLGCC